LDIKTGALGNLHLSFWTAKIIKKIQNAAVFIKKSLHFYSILGRNPIISGRREKFHPLVVTVVP
jgi:hypothetical protein